MRSFTDKKNIVQRTALVGILGAQALALSWLESLIPAFPFLPPGAKPGLSNIVTMFTVSTLRVSDAVFIVLIKAAFAGITRGLTAFLMSLCGGMMSLAAMCLIFKVSKNNRLGLIGSGVCCALAHNLGQIIAAAVITDTVTIAGYAPALLIFGVCTGIVTGCVFKAVSPLLIKISKHFVPTPKSTTGTN
ncbi:MAG: Gx transporter family protein [Clostridia bacterium]|nr:Gx transporter family protein [Clostridia bacterium]